MDATLAIIAALYATLGLTQVDRPWIIHDISRWQDMKIYRIEVTGVGHYDVLTNQEDQVLGYKELDDEESSCQPPEYKNGHNHRLQTKVTVE